MRHWQSEQLASFALAICLAHPDRYRYFLVAPQTPCSVCLMRTMSTMAEHCLQKQILSFHPLQLELKKCTAVNTCSLSQNISIYSYRADDTAEQTGRLSNLHIDSTVSKQAVERLTAMQQDGTAPDTPDTDSQNPTTSPHRTPSHHTTDPPAKPETNTSKEDSPSTSAPPPKKHRPGMPRLEGPSLSPSRKVAVLYELLYAAVSDGIDYSKKDKKVHKRPGYDARQRVALRLLAEWLDIPWKKVVRLCLGLGSFDNIVQDRWCVFYLGSAIEFLCFFRRDSKSLRLVMTSASSGVRVRGEDGWFQTTSQRSASFEF
jgi:hypothetical protein